MTSELFIREITKYSQTTLRAYRPWTDFLSLKWGYPYNGVYHSVQNMTGATRVTCVTAAFAASVRIWPGENRLPRYGMEAVRL